MNVLWLGFAVSDELASKVFAVDPLPAVQTHKFGWSFARALNNAFCEVFLASACPVQNFPLVRSVLFRGGRFSSKGFNGFTIGFVNIPIFKHFTRFFSCVFTLVPLILRKRVKWIFVHGVHSPFLFFALLARFFGCRVVVVLTDPPGVVLPTDNYLIRLMKRLDVLLIFQALKGVNAVVSLAPDLASSLAPTRPALVFPGILESTFAECQPAESLGCDGVCPDDPSVPFTILYAGGLSRAYGVDRLVDAIRGLDSGINIRLKLYGRGDQEEHIIRLAAEERRIVYGGFLGQEAIKSELFAAHLLVNPRPTSELFAAMSFPSKLIEYLATARPVLTTRIPSIPGDLKGFFYFIDNETVEGIRESILAVMRITGKDRISHGLAARTFVQTNYNEVMIGSKIRNFIDQLN